MASITVNSKGKVTGVKNGSKSNTSLSSNYTTGKNTAYNKSINASSSNQSTPSTVAQLPSQSMGSNVSANTPVIGSMDAPYYGITSNNTPVIGSMDGNKGGSANRSIYGINPSDDKIRNSANSIKKDTTENGMNTMGNLYGYGDKDGYYTTRQTAYTFKNPDGTLKTVYSNATNYNSALQDAINSGNVQNGATLEHASTYGTGSLTGDSYNYGATAANNSGYSGFGNGSDGGRYLSDKQYGNMYDQNNMQLAYLSGRDGKDYTNPYAGLAYNGNGLNNAYLKGVENYGTGNQAGSYGVGQAGLNDNALANYGNMQYQNSNINDTMNSILDNYNSAVEDNNSAIAAAYNYQKRRNEQDAEDNARALYVQRMIAEKSLPEQLASQGISGGLTESTLAEIHSNYQNAYNDNQQNLSNVNAQLESSKQQALASNNMAAAQYVSQIQQTTLQLQQSALEAQRAYELSLSQMAQARNESDRAYAMQMAQYNLDMANQQYSRSYAELQDQIQLAYQLGDYDTVEKLSGADVTAAKQLQNLNLMKEQLSYNSSLASYQKKTNPVVRSSGGGARSLNSDSDYGRLNSMPSNNTLGNYASGLYTDLVKSGYTPTQMDDYLTKEYQKGYITKNEAEMLASRLIGA